MHAHNHSQPFTNSHCHKNLPEANKLGAIYRAQWGYTVFFEPGTGSLDIYPAAGELHGGIDRIAYLADSVCPIPAPTSTAPYLDGQANISGLPLTDSDIHILSTLNNTEPAAG